MIFCPHVWSPYHCTEVLYFNKDKKHLRMFEVCQMCQKKRQVDFDEEETLKEAK